MPLGISLHDHFNHLPSPPPMNSLAVEQIQKPNQSNDIVRATSCWNKLILDFVCSYFQRMRDVSSFTQSNGWRIPSRPVVFFFFFLLPLLCCCASFTEIIKHTGNLYSCSSCSQWHIAATLLFGVIRSLLLQRTNEWWTKRRAINNFRNVWPTDSVCEMDENVFPSAIVLVTRFQDKKWNGIATHAITHTHTHMCALLSPIDCRLITFDIWK